MRTEPGERLMDLTQFRRARHLLLRRTGSLRFTEGRRFRGRRTRWRTETHGGCPILSTNVLSFMQFVAAGGWQSSQREAVIKQLHGLSFGAFVSFVFADKDLNLLRKPAANRG